MGESEIKVQRGDVGGKVKGGGGEMLGKRDTISEAEKRREKGACRIQKKTGLNVWLREV